MGTIDMNHCLNCGRSENEIPLVVLRFRGEGNWICSQCLPILIHHAHELESKLEIQASQENQEHYARRLLIIDPLSVHGCTKITDENIGDSVKLSVDQAYLSEKAYRQAKLK